MIQKIKIENYKCIDKCEFDLKPLTIITGLNSTGKSTLLQAILQPEASQVNSKKDIISTSFDVIKCKYIKQGTVQISTIYENGEKNVSIFLPKPNGVLRESSITVDDHLPLYGKGLYYLSANRIIDNTIPGAHPDNEGRWDFSNGLSIFSCYEMEKSLPVFENLRKSPISDTLQGQVNYWLENITGQQIELVSEKVTEELIILKYNSDGIPDILPSNLGTGVTYLAEVLIACLRAKMGDVILIENPEIHLHPQAQAKLGEFFAFIAKAGIQVIVETHCEHMINRVQYEVYKKKLSHKDVAIFYKDSIRGPFQVIPLKDSGFFAVEFPEGFYDATLKELIAMES